MAYRAATVLGQDDLKSADVVAAAVDRLNALAKHLGWLSLALPVRALQDTQVRVDDAVMPIDTLGEPIVLEPGPHVVTATANDATPFRSSIVLPEGAHVALTISLEPRNPPVPEPPPPPQAPSSGEATVPRPPAEVAMPRAEAPDGTRRTVGWVMVGSGGALLLGAAGLALARYIDISNVTDTCQSFTCPPGVSGMMKKDLDATRDRAVVETTISYALGASGLFTAAIGAYFVLSSKDASPVHTVQVRIAPLLTFGAGGIGVSGKFR
jgi:hypothetical protein